MLANKSAYPIAAVSDLARARDFYVGRLGLTIEDESDGLLVLRTGQTWLTVYESKGVRPGTGNVVVWSGGEDVEAIADDLRAKGVTLEEYPDLGMSVERGVHSDGDFRAIWFTDPDGNVLHVNSA